MRNGKKDVKRPQRGFTIIELLVVISIMAVIATLATGAALKAMKQSRTKRVEATCRALEMALGNFRAQESGWPFQKSDLEKDLYADDRKARIYWAHGVDNKNVFKPLYHGKGPSRTVYLDASALMAEYQGGRQQLRMALDMGWIDVPLIYPNPEDPSRINYYCVEFNEDTDSVKVHRQDQKHWSRENESECWCPKLKK